MKQGGVEGGTVERQESGMGKMREARDKEVKHVQSDSFAVDKVPLEFI